MSKKAIVIILVISTIIILTALPMFYFFFNLSPTGYSLRDTTNICKMGCENSFIECRSNCSTQECNENCNFQRGKCLFYC